MYLATKFTIEVTADESNIIGHMCYAAQKLWNVLNYERKNYKKDSGQPFPDYYYQNKNHKDVIWYRQLPSQTAQEICLDLNEAWKSYFAKSKKDPKAKPPGFKNDIIAITYSQNGIKHLKNSNQVRLSISKTLKVFMKENYDIDADFLYIENKTLSDIDKIKQIRILPPDNNKCKVVVTYEIPDTEILPDNNKYLSVDIGLHNLFACYNSFTGETFIAGREYLSIERKYNKEISRVQSQWHKTQANNGIKHPETSRHIRELYNKKHNVLHDYLHKITRAIVDYCTDNDINTLVIGDITHIRENYTKETHNTMTYNKSFMQKLHSLPYYKIYQLLSYKCALAGIKFVKTEESYTSQCSPRSECVSPEYSAKESRISRGLYTDQNIIWNADCVGAFNILRKYLQKEGKKLKYQDGMIKTPYILKVAV